MADPLRRSGASPDRDASRNAASTLRERHGLTQPVDVAEVVSHYATLEEANWPFTGVDGLSIDCGGLEPKIFFRSDVDRLRTRFTIAHELGHVMLAWHFGDSECLLDKSNQTDPREVEANAFAAELLMPEVWVADLMTEHKFDMTKVLSALGEAETSVTASLIALSSVLPVGWAFQMNNADPILSQERRVIRRRELDATCHPGGVVTLHGQTVRWWRRFRREVMPELLSGRAEADEKLMRVAEMSGNAFTAHQLHSKIAGLMGSQKTRRLLAVPELAYSYAKWRLLTESALQTTEFDSWLRWKLADFS
ncbi:ImmA/IrrE family metallo-endopeptidase [Rhodococcus sp. KRD162]|uniref:ImmA/IrrE family metallo-endopeptidase n=1 Tax=Rhodococcus sp. KRD162 TaxID=2729725 RepID=UPI0027DBA0D7|nr:ImmA/IrrE family metallo-endopeptidase [Rhodococcus sp. KRD162]